jgi:uncharacterized protein YeaO (DUF488 family)
MTIKTKQISKKFIPTIEDGKLWLIVFNSHWAEFHKMHFHDHIPELAPSGKLWKDYVKLKLITWEEYERRFKEEMAGSVKAQELMKQLAREYASSNTKHVTLLCFCPDERYCHRHLVKEMILSINQSYVSSRK